MYRKKDNRLTINDFILPFGGALAAGNRWVVKSKLIPWDEIEGDYMNLIVMNLAHLYRGLFVFFSKSAFGAALLLPASRFRTAAA